MTSLTAGSATRLDDADVVIVGAGIVGLAHAFHALERGQSVVVIDRDERAVGASVRNFGHCGFTVQDGQTLDFAWAARQSWLALAKDAGFWACESGTLVVARAEDEMATLEEFAQRRDILLLDAKDVAGHGTFADDVVGGALLPQDIRVNPREAVHAIAAYLADRGVRFHYRTAALAVEPGAIVTGRGTITARKIVVAVGHDVDRMFPQIAEDHGVQRCSLHMLRVANPHSGTVDPAVLTGLSMLRYHGFAACPSRAAVEARLQREVPEALRIDMNLMFTQLPDRDLTIGDTHAYSHTHDPYQSEELDEALLEAVGRLLGAGSLTVRERWRGIYASAPGQFLFATPAEDVRVVAVTSGIGMTTALGIAPRVLDDLL